jgi:hypothetical protein
MTIAWSTPPTVLIRGLEDYERQLYRALHALAVYWGQMVQDAARRDAPWEDRTGNARSGLFFAVDGLGLGTVTGEVSTAGVMEDDISIEAGDGGTLVITLGHTMWYGKWLELSNGGKNAIVLSTLQSNLPQLESMLNELLR